LGNVKVYFIATGLSGQLIRRNNILSPKKSLTIFGVVTPLQEADLDGRARDSRLFFLSRLFETSRLVLNAALTCFILFTILAVTGRPRSPAINVVDMSLHAVQPVDPAPWPPLVVG
jgi:hypothetical protein